MSSTTNPLSLLPGGMEDIKNNLILLDKKYVGEFTTLVTNTSPPQTFDSLSNVITYDLSNYSRILFKRHN